MSGHSSLCWKKLVLVRRLGESHQSRYSRDYVATDQLAGKRVTRHSAEFLDACDRAIIKSQITRRESFSCPVPVDVVGSQRFAAARRSEFSEHGSNNTRFPLHC